MCIIYRRTTKKRRRALSRGSIGHLKTRMWRYFTKTQSVRYVDVLQAFMRSYNDTYHHSIGMAPSEVTSTNQETVWQRLYGHESVSTPKFRVGDPVRIRKRNDTSKRGTWRTGQKNCLRLLTRTDPTHQCIVWSIATAINWTVRSTNQNSRRSSYRRARRIELSPSYGGVTREGKFW